MNLVTVKVVARFPNDSFEVVSVKIDFTGRKNLKNTKFWEDGSWHFVNEWEREDGKKDTYNEILMEGWKNGYN